MTAFTAIDAFCGAGGLSIGLKQSGFTVLAGFDKDSNCISTLRRNAKYINHRCIEVDIRSLLNGQLRRITGVNVKELDLLAGGPPCQGFSVQRTIGEDHDERNLLVDDYGDLVKDLLPKFFLLENVPGLKGKRGRIVLDRFEKRMKAEGYYVHKQILDAQYYGVPQRRKRLFVIGEKIWDAQPMYDWPHPQRNSMSVRDVIGNLPKPPEDGSDHPDFPAHRADRLSELNKRRLAALKDGQGRTDLPAHLLAACHRIGANVTGHRNVYGRMAWNRVAPTITARFDSFTRGQFGHPEQMRSISLYEGALLQTFPTDYRFVGSKVEVARQIGNAVPPRLARVLGHSIIQALQSTECRRTSVA